METSVSRMHGDKRFANAWRQAFRECMETSVSRMHGDKRFANAWRQAFRFRIMNRLSSNRSHSAFPLSLWSMQLRNQFCSNRAEVFGQVWGASSMWWYPTAGRLSQAKAWIWRREIEESIVGPD